MNFDLQRGPAGDVSTLLLGLVAPRPIALITSMDENGKLNAAPFCAYNHLCTGPPIIGVGLTNRPEQPLVLKDTGVLMQNRGVSFSLKRGALNLLAPGRLPIHTLNPALAVLKNGRIMAYGASYGYI